MSAGRGATVLPAAVAALAVATWLAVVLGLVWLAQGAAGRPALLAAWAEAWPLLALGWAAATIALVWAWRRWVLRPGRALAQLGEQARALLAAPSTQALAPADARARPLAEAIDALAAQRDALRADMTDQVRTASAQVQAEKDRLAALLAELPQSVVVCNLDGRILLYNQRAYELPGGAIGIGRSLHALIDEALLRHALQGAQERLARGDVGGAAPFVAYTRGGQLLRLRMAPVLAGGGAMAAGADAEITGFVLLIDDVTESFAEESERDHELAGLTEGSRAGLAAIRAAVEMLGYDDVEPAMRERFLAVVGEESARLGQRVDDLARRAADEVRTRWPLENMRGDDFVAAAQRHLQARVERPVAVAEVDPGLWLRVDSYSLLQALAWLAHRLVEESGAAALRLRLQAAVSARVTLDLLWADTGGHVAAMRGWEDEPMQAAGAGQGQITVRGVAARHDGEVWCQHDPTADEAFFRFLLPLGTARERTSPPGIGSRPEFYDFDLFGHRESDAALDEQPLAGLRYTVFDTETTGLDPTGGDAIIQIGAVRIVNGRLLAQETFEQLVNPGRDIPQAGIAIHGITQRMIAGQPRIEAVLPAFYRFAADSVLVGHNAAFDMKFLQLAQERSGVAFTQPVLDTLLLSAVAHPSQDTHRLEAIAHRLGVTVQGRHTALGDAMTTAQVWLRLVSELEAVGIRTLGQARAAAEQTYYARLKY